MKYYVLAGVLALSACTDPTTGFNNAASVNAGASQLQLSAARRARVYGIDVDPRSISAGQAARVLSFNTNNRGDQRVRSRIRSALGRR